jgi:hypothetical protein
VVQYGDMWEPSKTDSASPPREGASRLDRRFKLLNWLFERYDEALSGAFIALVGVAFRLWPVI